MTAPCYIDRSLLPVADQHVAARGRELWTIFLEASQNGKIALIHQLAAEALHIGCASFLFLVCAAMRKGAGRNRDGKQDERQKQFVHCVPSFRQTQCTNCFWRSSCFPSRFRPAPLRIAAQTKKRKLAHPMCSASAAS